MQVRQQVLFCSLAVALAACSSSKFASSSKPLRGAAGDGANGTNPDGSAKTTTDDQAQGAKNGTDDGAGGHGSGTDNGDQAGGLNDQHDTGAPPNINFGMMVNDLNCTMCHMEVHGSVISIGDASPLRSDSNGKIFGKWLVGGEYHADDEVKAAPRLGGITVAGGVVAKYDNAGKELPVSPATGKPAFPQLNLATVQAKAAGTVTSSATAYSLASASKVYAGNAILIGTTAKPIVIDKDVLIQGDLIIAGVYTGVGTLYATGNIYIPANLTALHAASFPYSDDAATGNAQGAADVKAGGKDALGLATAKNIFIGDLENYTDMANGPVDPNAGLGAHGQRYVSVYTMPPGTGDSQPEFYYTTSGVWDVYKWFPEARYEQLYGEITPCWTASNRALATGHHWGERTWNRIDAYLYAAKAIGGVTRASNWTLNGGMIAQSMHIISGADSDRVAGNQQCAANRINFDYRLQNNLPILERLGSQFAPRAAK